MATMRSLGCPAASVGRSSPTGAGALDEGTEPLDPAQPAIKASTPRKAIAGKGALRSREAKEGERIDKVNLGIALLILIFNSSRPFSPHPSHLRTAWSLHEGRAA